MRGMRDEYSGRAKELFRISSPIVLEQIFITLMGVVSTVMVSSVGEYAVSAVGMIDSISNLIIALFSALTTGGTIVVAQYIGGNNKSLAKETAAQAILLSFVISFVIFILFIFSNKTVINILYGGADADVIGAAITYFTIVNFSYPVLAVTQTIFGVLRGGGDTGSPMIITIIMNILNVVLSMLFIFGLNINLLGYSIINIPAMGVMGAAIGITLARLSGMLMGLVYIIKFSKTIRLDDIKNFKPNTSIQKVILGFGVPTSVESGLFQLGRLMTQVFIVSMGTAAIAANAIAGSIAGFINVPGNAFSTGVMVIVGQRMGRNQVDDINRTAYFAVFMGMLMLGIICAVTFPFMNFIVNIYNPSADSADIIKQLMVVYLLLTPLIWPTSFILPAALRATGDVKYTMVVAILSMTLVRVVLGYCLGVLLSWGVAGVWFGMYSDWVVRSLFFMIRLMRGKWRNKGIKIQKV